jgi:predicted RNA-binding Zn-ribbon protein involved in translation (DUF1610 family)
VGNQVHPTQTDYTESGYPERHQMMAIVTLTCPSCGGKLQISKDLERFACGFCGNEHVVKRGGGVVSLAPVMDSLAKIEARVNNAESELAARRLRQEIVGLDKN